MPETKLDTNLARDQYLHQDRSVNFKKHLEEQKQIEESGLKGIEIRKTNKQLGKDDFLQLLITQLTHQDPTAPVKDQAFIAQMAQFSSLEQMKNMSSTLKTMSEQQSGNLVGKFIIGKDHLSGDQVSGIAQAMFYDKSGDAFFKVGGRVVRVTDITLVGKPEMFKPEFGGTAPAEDGQHRTAENSEMPAVSTQVKQALSDSNTPKDNSKTGVPEAIIQKQARDAFEKNSVIDENKSTLDGRVDKP